MTKKKKITLILLIIFFIGLSVLLYPSLANFWNSRTQSQVVEGYEKMIQKLSPEDYTAIFRKANEYNAALAALNYPLFQYQEVPGYEDTLNMDGNGVIGYLTIKKIQVNLPIYHGVSDEVLTHACGHMQGTSLPVGGIGNHSVISAHRGLPSAKLFTNLDRLEVGDTFRVTVLDREYNYEIDQIKTVLPEDTNDVAIDPEMDYCTLLTCTPYGINTHRLLVRGVRTSMVVHNPDLVNSDAYLVDKLIVTTAVAIPIVLGLILYVYFKPAKKKVNVHEEGEDDI